MKPSVQDQCGSATKRGHGPCYAIVIGITTLLMAHLFIARGSGQAVALRQVSVVTEQVIAAEENDLSPIAAIRVSGKGRVAIWQQQDFQVRFFDSSGKSLGKFGRKGEGPGDFRAIGMRGRLDWRHILGDRSIDSACDVDRCQSAARQ